MNRGYEALDAERGPVGMLLSHGVVPGASRF